jgi:hypothetical protein
MCVLNLYDENSASCRLYNQILNEAGKADLVNGFSGWYVLSQVNYYS